MRSALLLLGVLLALPHVAAAERVKVAVVTRTDPDARGFTSPDQRDRLDSVKDLIEFLREEVRRTIEVVKPTERTHADVVIEVLSREDDLANDIRTVHLRLTAGDYSFNLDGAEDRWKGAAKKAAESVRAWIRDNRARLLATRTGGKK
jgi:hypothetical protein